MCPPAIAPGTRQNVSQIESVRPSTSVAPSIWNDAVAVPHENPTGNVNVEREVVGLDAVTGPSMGQGGASAADRLHVPSRPRWASPGTPASASSTPRSTCSAPAGVDAVSLDEIAREVGVRKQTVLYWFPSKDDLVDAVLETAAAELAVVIDAAVRSAPDDPLDRIDAVVRAVFRPAVRRPALLGLVREVGRLPAPQAARLREHVAPLVERAIAYLDAEMARGRLRRADPGTRRRARLRDGHRHRHRTGGVAGRRLAGRRHRPAPPARRAAGVPPRRPRAEPRPPRFVSPQPARSPMSVTQTGVVRWGGQCLVLRRRRAWRSRASSTRRSISSA